MVLLRLRRAVTLGPLHPESAPTMYRWMCDPVISANLGLRTPPSLDKTIEWIQRARDNSSLTAFSIHLEGKHVGNVVIDRIDTYLATGRMSVYVGEATARGTGVGTTGMYLALEQAFSRLNLNKIWLTVHARNFVAINAYCSLNFKLEGVLREEFWLNDERLSALYMGLLRTEFEQLLIEWS